MQVGDTFNEYCNINNMFTLSASFQEAGILIVN